MKINFSLYLDLIRFSAAVLVLLHHLSDLLFSSTLRVFNVGHESVVIFFVLSGYVISYSVKVKDYSCKEYFVARFSRIYSVVIPALFLTIILDVIGTSICRDCYQDMYVALDYPVIRFLASITFTGELWFISILSFSNIPFWSIHYEVFFYVFFGAMLYAHKKYKLALLALLLLIAGPKIAILLPLWLLGAFLYRPDNYIKSTVFNLLIWLLTFFLLLALLANDGKSLITGYGNDFLYGVLGLSKSLNLAASKYFIFDYFFGVIFALNLIISKSLIEKIKFDFDDTKLGTIVRYLANRTFSIYLFHFPLIGFYNAILPHSMSGVLRWTSIIILTVVSIFILSNYTEQKKHIYSKWLRIGLNKLSTLSNNRQPS
jgi:peptidoglycan/LPS O-acetylase OafA/YrhL